MALRLSHLTAASRSASPAARPVPRSLPCARYTGSGLTAAVQRATLDTPLTNPPAGQAASPSPGQNGPSAPVAAVVVADAGLSGGAIAGIVVGAVVGALLLLGAAVLAVRHRRSVSPTSQQQRNQLGNVSDGGHPERLPGRHDPEGPPMVEAKLAPA